MEIITAAVGLARDVVAETPREAVVAVATIGLGLMVGTMVRTRLQASVNWCVLVACLLGAYLRGGDR